MAGKRSSTTRAQGETVRRGRPRRAARSTYATAGQEGAEDEQLEANQVPPVEEQPEPMIVQ